MHSGVEVVIEGWRAWLPAVTWEAAGGQGYPPDREGRNVRTRRQVSLASFDRAHGA